MIREHVASFTLTYAPAAGRPYVMLSIGVANYETGRLMDAATLIDAADRALDAAK